MTTTEPLLYYLTNGVGLLLYAYIGLCVHYHFTEKKQFGPDFRVILCFIWPVLIPAVLIWMVAHLIYYALYTVFLFVRFSFNIARVWLRAMAKRKVLPRLINGLIKTQQKL